MSLPYIQDRDEAEAGRFFDARSQIAREVLANRTDRRILVDGPLGTGKAQPDDATVWTPSGPRRMGDLAVGDTVLTPTGTAAVVAVYPQGMQPVYRVTFTTGEVVECTSDHLWTVHYTGGGKRGANRRRVMSATKPLSELRIPRRGAAKQWVPAVGPAAFAARPVPLDPYLLGLLMGDGHIRRSGAATITTTDNEIVAAAAAALPGGHELVHHGRMCWSIRANRCSSVRRAKRGYVSLTASGRWMARGWDGPRQTYIGLFDSREAADAAVNAQPPLRPVGEPTVNDTLRSLGVAGCRAWEKVIPEEYLINSPDVRLAVLQGLMDTDGTVDRKTGMPSYTSTSREMAEQVVWLLRSLGGAGLVTVKITARRPAYTVHCRYDDGPALFRLSRKKAIAKRRSKYPVRRYIERIEPAGSKPCRCIRIDSEDCLYLTDGFIPTHNSRLLLERARACCLRYPRSRWLMLRLTRNSLTQSALVTWEDKVVLPSELVPDRVRREGRSRYLFRNGSEMVVAGLDDPQKVFSAEYDGAVLIEAIEVSKDTVEKVDGRLRNGRMPYQQLLMDCNPGPPSHWLHAAFTSGWCRRYPMRHTDNPALYLPDGTRTRFGEQYLSRLDDLTGVNRARLRDGRWVQAEGAIYEEWDAAVHVVDRFQIPADWPRYWAVDFGFTNPLSWTWWAEDPDGGLWCYREIYQTGRLVSDVAAEAALYSEGEPRPRACVTDHDPEAMQQIQRATGVRCTPADKNDRKGGIQQVKDRLRTTHEGKPRKPRLHIFRDCLVHAPSRLLHDAGKPTSIVSEFETYVWDPKRAKGEEPLKENDHAMDGARYLIAYVDGKPRGTAGYGADYEANSRVDLPAGTFGRRQPRESGGDLPPGTFG